MTLSVRKMDAKSTSFMTTTMHGYGKDIKSLLVLSHYRNINNTFRKTFSSIPYRILSDKSTPIQSKNIRHHNMSQPWLVEEQDRCNYGLQWQQVIATNQAPNVVLGPQNFHYPPEKNVLAVQGQQDQQYIQDFETNIRSSLKDSLVSKLSDCTWTLNVLRLGFKDNRSENPIVIHLCIQTPDYFLDVENNRDFEDTRNNAIKVLEGMNKIISEKKKSSEKYVLLHTHSNLFIGIFN